MRNRVQCSVFEGRQARAERERTQQYQQQRRLTANGRLYQTQAWRTLRALQLEACPHCYQCGKSATVVDHNVPHRGDQMLFFDPDNLRSMCKRCHDSKTARHDGGFGRAPRIKRNDGDSGFGLL
jgi:5-methylcytosine-specific restriction protein A